MVSLLVKAGVFKKQLDRKWETETSDRSARRTAKMATGILLHKYQMCTRGNQNKATLNSDLTSNESDKIDLNTNDKDM